ncbi:MAG: spermidine/putrescine ABC transporter substrate-binding protein [Propionibacteriales bacterium]|nr:spermidine/putrescine ABC transporter substrate-binding protein [Propionibacteriales bacterium]
MSSEREPSGQHRLPARQRRGALTRRTVLGLALTAAASACTGGDGDPPPPRQASGPDIASEGTTPGPLVWANWPDYLDAAGGGSRHPTLDTFVERTGIHVDYREVINDNQEYVASISSRLEAGRPVGCDVMTLTSWMAARLVSDDLLQPLGKVPNSANLISALAHPDWDPEGTYSLPWQAGLTGIAYDARKVERAIGGVHDLFTRPDLNGRVGLLTEFPDTLGLTLLAQGRDLSAVNTADVDAALDTLTDATDAGRFAGYYGNDFVGALARGRIAACLAWSGDILQAQLHNPYVKFVVPEEGLMIWADNLLVPKASTKGDEVARLLNYYYQPEVAAKVAASVNYICPVDGAQASMERIDPDLALSPLIFPDATILDVSHQFPTLPASDDAALRARFADIASSVPA